jgi:hypothetical protein
MTAGLPRSRLRACTSPISVANLRFPPGPGCRWFWFGELMTPMTRIASDARAAAEGGDVGSKPASTGPFVLNLCSSTTPMALAQTDLPELKRFNFFVSRRFEEGRERFRLHMGYFATLAEAEEWLGLVREIYPGAWAGEAPGRKIRERAAAAAAAAAQHAAGPQTHAVASAALGGTSQSPPSNASPSTATRSTPAAAATGGSSPARAPVAGTSPAQAPLRVPVVHAAPPITRAATQAVPSGAPRAQPAAKQAQPVVKAQPVVARTQPAPPASANAVPAAKTTNTERSRSASNAAPGAAAAAAAAAVAPVAAARTSRGGKPAVKPVFEDSNVREVLKALGDASATGETRLMKAPSPPREIAAPESGSLSDTQVLRLLEARRPEGGEAIPEELTGGIPLLKPDDTGTRRALREAVVSNDVVSFAVQLQWSVQPVELDKVPPLAIFSAYTLYTVEGSRDGRKWYGLRLGFFSDAIAAKQVAQYVRSEFTSVAVVPVSPQEKARATDDEQAATLAAPATRRERTDEFKLLDDDAAAPPSTSQRPAERPAPLARSTKPTQRPAIGRALRQADSAPRVRERPAGKVGPRDRRGAPSLEETLEILGASELSIDNGTGETLNDSGVRHLRVKVQKESPFTRLLERLSERMKKA